MGIIKKIKNTRGVTFTEVIVSLLLLGITIGAVIGAFVMGSMSTARVKHRITAINLAREKIEIVRAVDFAGIPAQAGTENITIDAGSASSGDELTGQRTTAVLDVSGSAKEYKITVSVSWTENAASNTLQERIITLISDQ